MFQKVMTQMNILRPNFILKQMILKMILMQYI